MKKIILILMIFFGISTYLFANERDDLAYLDELYSQKKFSLAIEESNRFVSTYPESRNIAKILERLAKTYFLNDDYKNTIRVFKMYLENGKITNVNEVNYYLMRSYASIGDKKESDYYLLLIDRNNDYYARGLYEVGMEYVEREDYVNAQKKLNEVVMMGARYKTDALLGLALMSYNNKQYSNALVYLDQLGTIRSSDKNYIIVNYLYGSIYSRSNNLADAITRFKNVVSRDSTSSYGKRSLTSLIDAYIKTGNDKEVEELLGNVKNTKDKDEISIVLGDSYADKGNYSKAVEYYGKVIDTKNLQAIYGMGYSYYKLGRNQDAQRYFERLNNTSYYSKALFYIFSTDYKLKNYKKILNNRNIPNKVKISKSDSDNIKEIIANAAYELGDFNLAINYYKDIYTKTQSKENLYKIIVATAKNNDVAGLEKAFNEFNKAYPDDTVYKQRNYNAMGSTYYNKNRIDDAINVYKKYLNGNKDKKMLSNLIAMLLNGKKYNELLVYLDMDDDTLDNRYLKGIANIGIADYQKADKIFGDLLKNSGIAAELAIKVKFNQVRNYFLWGKYQEAINIGEEYLTIENAPDKEEIIDKIGVSYFRLDNFAKSREIYEKLLSYEKSAEYAMFQIAEGYYGEKKLQEAREAYKAVYDKYPDGGYSEQAYYWYLNTLANMGDMGAFNNESGLFLEKYPKSQLKDNVLMLSGAVYEYLKNNDKAIEYYENLYNTSKTANIKNNAAERILEILLINEQLDRAKKFVEKLPNDEMKTYYVSMIYARENNSEAAFKEHEKLKNSKKYGDYGYLNIGTYYFVKKNYENARQNYQKALDFENSKYKDLAMYQMAACDEFENKFEDAFRGYSKCYMLYIGNYSQVAKIKAGQMAEKIGKEAEARNIYKELYQLGEEINKKEYKEFVLERMVYYSAKSNLKDDAKKYIGELEKINKELALKCSEYLKN
ncbi:MAG: tetratricopeptide repeat protein [Fusobacteriaceae bacterium]|jgi:tetratricopeptide (TPR) repeat protein|nr:tetratricopeptide repeat protein [Fusobacteriaceae bacterium]